VLLVCQECPVLLRPRRACPSLRHHANRARLDHPARLDHLVPLETPANQELPAAPDKTPRPDPLDPKDRPDHLESPDSQDPLESQDPPPKANHSNPESQDPQENQAHRDPLDPQDSRVETDSLDRPDRKARKDPEDPPEPMVFPDLKAHLALLARKESGVSAPSTAPWMAESSSRMAQDDKRMAAPDRDFLFETASSFVQSLLTLPWPFVFIIAFGQSVTSQLSSQSSTNVESFGLPFAGVYGPLRCNQIRS
jgi:hypothetical protein